MDSRQSTKRARPELPFIHILGLSMYSRTEGHHPIEQAGVEALLHQRCRYAALD